MKVLHGFSKWILPLISLGLILALLSCAPAETGPRAWIDWPRDGFETDVGSTVTVIAHGYAEDGVGEVRLDVDGQAYRVVSPEPAGEQLARISLEWFADLPGSHLLSVTALDVNGQASNSASVTVIVRGEGPVPSVTPGPEGPPPPESPTPEEPAATVAPIETPPPPTAASPAPTRTPLPPTSTPPPPAATTPPPPRIVSFEVNRSRITVGECVRFSWRVEGYPTAIYFDGQGATSPETRQVCPTATREFELRAEGPSGVDAQSIRVVVVEPSPTPDTQGPAAPGGLSPSGGEGQGCGAVTLSWNAVSDPSGIRTYYVKVEKTSGAYKSGAWQTTDTEYTIAAAWLECGQTYEWAVQAEDGAGNVGPLSAWAQFSMDIT